MQVCIHHTPEAPVPQEERRELRSGHRQGERRGSAPSPGRGGNAGALPQTPLKGMIPQRFQTLQGLKVFSKRKPLTADSSNQAQRLGTLCMGNRAYHEMKDIPIDGIPKG